MENYFKLLIYDFKKLWNGLDFTQRMTLVVLSFACVATISYFVTKSTQPDWALLYSDLNETDAIAVIDNLKKAGYQYKVSDDKKSIFVPSTMKEELRIMVAENDIIQDSNPGFELLDKVQFGTTDFQNRLTRQRIFQGELTRTIERIRGIKKARVQIAEPERSVFSSEDDRPTASVMLIIEPGSKLKSAQVKAIKNLVAYAIPRLLPERVFITDQNGKSISDDITKSSTDIESFRTNFEKETSAKVYNVLAKIVGEDNVSVQVSTLINFDSAKATIERYIPTGEDSKGILTSAQLEEETYDNGKIKQEKQEADGETSGNTDKNKLNYAKRKNFTNYNVSKEVKQIVYAPGTIKRMTIAVALNKILTSKEKAELQNLIISAAGADLARGDTVNITSMQFAPIENNQAKADELYAQIQKEAKMNFLINKVGPLVVVLVLGVTALIVLNNLLNRPYAAQYTGGADAYANIENELEEIESAKLPAIETKLDPEAEKMKTDINDAIMADPQEASRLLLTFIKD